MKTKYSFIDPSAIMGVVVALIVLAVGVFAFFVTMNSIPNRTVNSNTYMTQNAQINNTSATATQVFNIVGIVMIIGAIMSIIGLVYTAVR